MVSLKAVEESNANLKAVGSGKVALFVGATSGLGLATLNEFVRHADAPKVYIVGRSAAKLKSAIADLEKLNAQGKFIPIQGEIELFKNIDAACAEFQSKEQHLDYLIMSQGYIKVARLDDNADGVEPTLSLRYYGRMRFAQKLLPQLRAAPAPRIVSILAGGKEGRLNEADLLLQRTFSIANVATHTATMNTLALQALAAQQPRLSCVHVFPGIVMTDAYTVLAEHWAAPLRWQFEWVGIPLMRLFAVSLEESGKRHLFHATSARYPPSGIHHAAAGAGASMPAGVGMATGADGKEGSGCYLLNWDGETVDNKKLLDEYREKGWDEKIWEHTDQVFNQAAS